MAAEDQWNEVKSLLGEPTIRIERLQSSISGMLSDSSSRFRFLRWIESDQDIPCRPTLIKVLVQALADSGRIELGIAANSWIELVDNVARIANGIKSDDPTYWLLLWVRLNCRLTPNAAEAIEAAESFLQLSKHFSDPAAVAKHLKDLTDWADLSADRWSCILGRARAAEKSDELRSQLHAVITSIKNKGSSVQSRSREKFAAKSNPTKPPESIESLTHNTTPTTPTSATENEINLPSAVELGPKSERGQAYDKAVLEAATSVCRLDELGLDSEAAAIGDQFTIVELATEQSAVDAVPEQFAAPETPPTKTTGRKGASRKSSDSTKEKPSGEERRAESRNSQDQLSAVMAQIATAAVHAISERLEGIASRTVAGAALEQRLADIERTLAGMDRTLNASQTGATATREECERLRRELREREAELAAVSRQRDVEKNRADHLQRQLATSDARIAAAEARADQNIHDAFRERDSAVLTFKVGLWDAIQADLIDISEPTPGETFASDEEEILMQRLRRILDVLRRAKVTP